MHDPTAQPNPTTIDPAAPTAATDPSGLGRLAPRRRAGGAPARRPRLVGALGVVVGLVVFGLASCTPASHFGTTAVAAALPTGATCAAQVRSVAETRAMNAPFNQTKGTQKNLTQPYPLFSRVDGNFTGTTDEIIQWAACKWGIDEDILRAQVAVESWWDQRTVGDFQSTAANCVPGHPIGADGKPGLCPASGGLLALTYQYYGNGFPQAMTSTAYNVDYVAAWWRSCYTGKITWLNDVEKGATYAAGDAWGCIGAWFAGRWHTPAAEGYITKVKSYQDQKIWTTASFLSYR